MQNLPAEQTAEQIMLQNLSLCFSFSTSVTVFDFGRVYMLNLFCSALPELGSEAVSYFKFFVRDWFGATNANVPIRNRSKLL